VNSTPPPSTKLSKAMLSSWSVSVLRSVPNVAVMRRCTLTVLRYGAVELARVQRVEDPLVNQDRVC
jgi:hypothetical protein